jgi:hypothetical protein
MSYQCSGNLFLRPCSEEVHRHFHLGSSSEGCRAPLRICRRTGMGGLLHDTLFIRNNPGGTSKPDDEVQINIRLSNLRYPWSAWIDEWMKGALIERQFVWARRRSRVLVGCSRIPQDRHVLPTVKCLVGLACSRHGSSSWRRAG